jgi:hypothetical protein
VACKTDEDQRDEGDRANHDCKLNHSCMAEDIHDCDDCFAD